MKKEPVIREVCGSINGYNRHRYYGEEKCQRCKDAYNAWRRGYTKSTPEKQKAYRDKYYENPENVAARAEYAAQITEQKRNSPEAIAAREAREAERAEKARIREENRFVKQKAYDELCASRTAATEVRKAEQRVLSAIKKEQYREDVALARATKNARKEYEQEKADQYKAFVRSMKELVKEAGLQGRSLLRQTDKECHASRPIEHGTTVGEYDRCRARKKGSCQKCKEVVAQYMRDHTAKDPEKRRAREKAYREKFPEKTRDRRRLATNRRERNAKLNGQIAYTRREILERDDYTCYLCGEKVDLSAPHQTGVPGWEMYPHLDHVIPVSKGGPDTPDNVRTTHAKCNLVKSDKLLGDEMTTSL